MGEYYYEIGWGLDSPGSGLELVAGSCEHGKDPSGSIKCRGFLDYLNVPLASQEGLCSIELVRRWHVVQRPVL
jgi:hypothetical protein